MKKSLTLGKDFTVRNATNALVKHVHEVYDDLSSAQKAAILGRSKAWYTKRAQSLGLMPVNWRSKESFFEFLDSIELGKSKIISGYATSTVVNYVSHYCNASKEYIRYIIKEVEPARDGSNRVSIKLFLGIRKS